MNKKYIILLDGKTVFSFKKYFKMSILLKLMYVLCLVAQSCPTLCDPVDCSPPGSSVSVDAGVYWMLEEYCRNTGVGPMPSSRGSSQPRDWTHVSHMADRFFTIWVIREPKLMCTSSKIPSKIVFHETLISWYYNLCGRTAKGKSYSFKEQCIGTCLTQYQYLL